MDFLQNIPFAWAIGPVALFIIAFGLKAFFGYRSVARDAEEDYNYKQPQGMVDKNLPRESYIKVYKRFHNPRSAAYIALTTLAILLLTWPAMALLSFLLETYWQVTGRSRVFEPGFLVWQFLIFFGLITIWSLIAYTMARQYHLRSPGTFKYELEQELIEIKTGKRDKEHYGHHFGVPPFVVIIGVFGVFFSAILWKMFGASIL